MAFAAFLLIFPPVIVPLAVSVPKSISTAHQIAGQPVGFFYTCDAPDC
jgi:hypothetical protein